MKKVDKRVCIVESDNYVMKTGLCVGVNFGLFRGKGNG